MVIPIDQKQAKVPLSEFLGTHWFGCKFIIYRVLGSTMIVSAHLSKRSQSLLLTFILLCSGTMGLLSIPSADADSARSTGMETLTVNVVSDYYERGSSMTLVATSSNLDEVTEYSLEYTLCRATGTWDYDTESMDIECTELLEQISGSIDLGSGNLVSLTATSIEDTECCQGIDSFSNGTMMFIVNLTSQDITISSSASNVFVLGDEIQSTNLDVTEGDVLLGMSYDIHAFWGLEFNNLDILSYTTECSLLDDNGDAIDTTSEAWNGPWQTIDPFFSLEATIEGEYQAHCDLIRDFDGELIASHTGTIFEYLEADYTGLESIDAITDSIFYEHNNSLTLSISLADLYIGTEYTLNYNMCDIWAGYDSTLRQYTYHCGADIAYGIVDDPATTGVDETEIIDYSGQFIFTPVADTHTEQVTINIPSCCGDVQENFANNVLLSVDSLKNDSLAFELSLELYNVVLVEELSNTFVLGGELTSDYIAYGRDTILIGMDSVTKSHWYLDTPNTFTLTYTITCDLHNSTTGLSVESKSRTWNHNSNPGADIYHLPPSPGEYYSQCTLTRDIDGTLLGTQVSGPLTVIDVNYTGEEEHRLETDYTFYPHSSSIELSIIATDVYPDTTYTAEYSLCKIGTDYENGVYETFCSGAPWSHAVNIPIEDQTLLSGQVDFTPTSSTHIETVTIPVPECCGDFANSVTWWLENASMAFESTLVIQGVELAGNTPVGYYGDESSYFTIGGEVSSSQMLQSSDQLLLNMNLYVDMIWILDHRNEFTLSYEEQCNFIDAITLGVIASTSSIWNHRPDQVNTMNSVFTPPAEGEYYVECTLTRMVDSMLLSTHTGDLVTVLPDLGNQDDATLSANKILKPEGWALVLFSLTDLDAGQQYSVNWEVVDNSTAGTTTVMDSGDFIWVEGTDSIENHILEFRSLADSTDACLSVDLYAADQLLVSLVGAGSNPDLCWNQNSESDVDSDGVFDKTDQCPATPYGSIVQTNGCSDADLDGWDDSVEIECNSDYQNPTSIPVDFDQDGICDPMDPDDDDDGFTDQIEYQRGTNPFDLTDFPVNQLPVCTFYYTLELDGLPVVISGEAEASVLVVGTSSVPGVGTGITPIITVPAGSYFVIVTCVDIDNDPIILSVNNMEVGPAFGEVTASAILMLTPSSDESMDAVIAWSDGTNTAGTVITVNLEQTGSTSSYLPGFTASLGILALLGATIISRKEGDESN